MKRKIASFLVMITTCLSVVGCGKQVEETKLDPELQSLRDQGIIAYEESTKGIDLDTENITEKLKNGHYYILHDDTLYPAYTYKQTYEDVMDYGPDGTKRFDIYNSENIIDMPTLFEGDKLLYFNKAGVLDFSTFERFRDLGWSIGLRKIQSTSGGYLYVDITDEESYDPSILKSLKSLTDDISEDKESHKRLLIDKIGGVRLTSDFIENGIITNLLEGVSYDLEVYDGTNYKYHTAKCDTRYFQSMELYALADYEPLQDYLYEIKIPDYLPQGYYNIDGKGMFRYVKAKQYDDSTEFNEKLLYEYDFHDEGDYSASENRVPQRYSEVESLNYFKAYDVGCFGYKDPNLTAVGLENGENGDIAKDEAKSEIALANFVAASKTETELWLPDNTKCSITITSPETTGSIYIKSPKGGIQKLNFDRIAGTYSVEVVGKGEKYILVVQGLYHDYTINLKNAESYNGQDIKDSASENNQTDESKDKDTSK